MKVTKWPFLAFLVVIYVVKMGHFSIPEKVVPMHPGGRKSVKSEVLDSFMGVYDRLEG